MELGVMLFLRAFQRINHIQMNGFAAVFTVEGRDVFVTGAFSAGDLIQGFRGHVFFFHGITPLQSLFSVLKRSITQKKEKRNTKSSSVSAAQRILLVKTEQA